MKLPQLLLLFALLSQITFAGEGNEVSRFSRKSTDRSDYELYRSVKGNEQQQWIKVPLRFETHFSEAAIGFETFFLPTGKPDVRFTYHPEFSIRLGDGNGYFNLFPSDEAISHIHLKLTGKVGDLISIQLSDEEGKILLQQQMTLQEEQAFVALDVTQIGSLVDFAELVVKAPEFWEGITLTF